MLAQPLGIQLGSHINFNNRQTVVIAKVGQHRLK